MDDELSGVEITDRQKCFEDTWTINNIMIYRINRDIHLIIVICNNPLSQIGLFFLLQRGRSLFSIETLTEYFGPHF
jgi:hypothetical protein